MRMRRERGGNTHGGARGAAGSTMKGGIERGGGRAGAHNRGGQRKAKRSAARQGRERRAGGVNPSTSRRSACVARAGRTRASASSQASRAAPRPSGAPSTMAAFDFASPLRSSRIATAVSRPRATAFLPRLPASVISLQHSARQPLHIKLSSSLIVAYLPIVLWLFAACRSSEAHRPC